MLPARVSYGTPAASSQKRYPASLLIWTRRPNSLHWLVPKSVVPGGSISFTSINASYKFQLLDTPFCDKRKADWRTCSPAQRCQHFVEIVQFCFFLIVFVHALFSIRKRKEPRQSFYFLLFGCKERVNTVLTDLFSSLTKIVLHRSNVSCQQVGYVDAKQDQQ